MTMTISFRPLAAVLLLAAPLAASAAQPGGSDLDRMSDTGGILGRAAAPQDDGGAGTANLGPCGPAPCPPPNAPPVPLDGGLSLLAVAGAGYAARRLRARRGGA